MDIANKLAQLNADPALKEWVLAQVTQAQKSAAEVSRLTVENHAKECKINALTLELAYHKRLKFSAKTEAFTAQQRDLFLETEQSDLAAMQAELAQLSPATTPRKPNRTQSTTSRFTTHRA